MLVGSIVFVQIFIGVILETFKTWNGISLMTLEQRRWVDLRRQIRLIRPTATPERPQNPFRAFCYDLIQKRGILWHMMTMVLVLNVCLIASQHYGQPEVLTDIQGKTALVLVGLRTTVPIIELTMCYSYHVRCVLLHLPWTLFHRDYGQNHWLWFPQSTAQEFCLFTVWLAGQWSLTLTHLSRFL
jgi:hypothetical protein